MKNEPINIEINTDLIKKYGANECVLASVLEDYYYNSEEAYNYAFYNMLPKAKYKLFDIDTFEKLENLLGEDFPIIKTFERLNYLEILDYKKNNRLPGLNWHSHLTVLLDPLKI